MKTVIAGIVTIVISGIIAAVTMKVYKTVDISKKTKVKLLIILIVSCMALDMGFLLATALLL